MNLAPLSVLQKVRGGGSNQTQVTISNTQPIDEMLVPANVLSVVEVEAILLHLDANGQLNGTVDLSGQTPPAPPASLAAWTAVSNLKAKGWTVTVDPPVDWTPSIETVTWTDSGGLHSGDLPTFLANADIGTVISLIFGGTGNLTSLTGLQNLPVLNRLDCNTNSLASLDITGCVTLTNLDCSHNLLTTLDVGACLGLVQFDCSYNQLTTLDVSGHLSLVTFYCFVNALTSLNVSGCAALGTLNCSNNVLTTLDVSDCVVLTYLDCSLNSLIALDVTACTSLSYLNCSVNTLASLNVTGCAVLANLDCSNTGLAALDITTCTLLTTLYCQNNGLTVLDASLNPFLITLDCSFDPITDLDVTACAVISSVTCNNCALATLEVTGCSNLSFLNANANFLPSLVVDQVLTDLLPNAVFPGSVDLSSQLPSPPSPSGIAAENVLVAGLWSVLVDPGMSAPIFADGSGGYWQLVVDTSGVIGTNAVAGPASPGTVVLNDGTPAYWKIGVDALGVPFTTADVGPETLPLIWLTDANGHDWGLYVDVLGNLFTAELITWAPYSSPVTWVDGGGLQYGDMFVFRATVDLSTLGALNFAAIGLTNLYGISNLPNLQTLDCGSNGLISLKVSDCPLLQYIDCTGNSITTLEVNNCPSLLYLTCDGNALSALDLSGVVALNVLRCRNNVLTSLDVSPCSALNALRAHNNLLPTVAGLGSTLISYCDLSSNPLTQLGVNSICVAVDTVATNIPVYAGTLIVTTVGGVTPPSSGPPDGASAVADLIGTFSWSVTTD